MIKVIHHLSLQGEVVSIHECPRLKAGVIIDWCVLVDHSILIGALLFSSLPHTWPSLHLDIHLRAWLLTCILFVLSCTANSIGSVTESRLGLLLFWVLLPFLLAFVQAAVAEQEQHEDHYQDCYYCQKSWHLSILRIAYPLIILLFKVEFEVCAI